MKKILFILIFFVVNSFALNLIFQYGDAEWCVGEVSRGTSVYEDNTNFHNYHWTNSNGHNIPYTLDQALVAGHWWVSVGSYKHKVLTKVVQIDCNSNEPICPDGQSWNSDSSSCVVICPPGQEVDPSTNTCINSCDPLNGSLQDGSGGCIDCSYFNDLQLRADCLCSGFGFFDGADSPSAVFKEDHNGSMYSYYKPYCKGSYIEVPVYLKDEDLNFNSDPCTTAISWGAVTPVGFIFKGSVNSDGACSQYVDGVNYLDSRTKKAFPDCPSNNTLYCFLKPSADNNDTGIPAPDSNQTNSDGNLDSNTSIPQLDINSTPSGGYSMASQEKTNNILGQVSSNLKSFTDKYTRDNAWWQKDNTMKFNARTANDNANNGKLISSIDSLNKSLGDKLDTLADKNTSVDLSPATTKLDQLHKDLNTTNIKLQAINDVLHDLNSTFDINSSGLSLSDMLPSESWFSSHTLDLSGVNNYDGDCYLESFTWTDGSGVHTFPPQNVIDMIPFEVISNIMFAFLYLIGLRQFLRS